MEYIVWGRSPRLCIPDTIPRGWAFDIPSLTGLIVVSAAFNISITESQEKDRRVNLKTSHVRSLNFSTYLNRDLNENQISVILSKNNA